MKSRIFALTDSEISKNELSGNGNRQVLVIVKQADSEEKTLLDLLKAIKLDPIEDIYKLVETSNSTLSINGIIDELAISKVLVFGISAKDLGYNINQAYYHIYEFTNHKLLLSESIQELNTHKDKKIALWQSLQKLFLQ